MANQHTKKKAAAKAASPKAAPAKAAAKLPPALPIPAEVKPVNKGITVDETYITANYEANKAKWSKLAGLADDAADEDVIATLHGKLRYGNLIII